MKTRNFISIDRLPLVDLFEIFEVCARQKHTLEREGRLADLFPAKTLGMMFEKPSLRTRVSFEVAMTQLGGTSVFLGAEEVQLGKREAVRDFARVMCRYVDGIVARVFQHKHVVEIARNSRVPVVNALSDYVHPCQALADLWTVMEYLGKWEGVKLAYIGDANNVARSLGFICAKLGLTFAVASPSGYSFSKPYLRKLEKCVTNKAFKLQFDSDPRKIVRRADVVYTDVWASMGQEGQARERRQAFQGYQVNPELMALARPGAFFMHDLPAHPGEEIAEGMLEHPQSVAFDQAENKLHAVKAVLELLLGQIAGR